ncbi:acyl-CoA dehydrogenase NM domain-like protein [Amniculicola lignicola CBS 123094]|uniref:Acyl-CoA dehydrogenase NM domain-like protein n=1 Tax=Amniculicola lignicola CBS 123094 TaxID=1392246 RepID=A0A6A5X4M6_9PLEO|nr:acyl-CoA dehydrogenase NM domain-like protein [Amniculicola lignicola CBS 123094]
MLDFTLSPAQQTLRTNACSFAQNVLSTAPSLYSHLTDQNARFLATKPIYKAAVRAGLIKAQVPIPLGGTAASLLDEGIVVEEFYAVEPSAAITVLGTGLGLAPLLLAGNAELWERFLPEFLKTGGDEDGDGEGEENGGELPIAAFVHSEPGGTANWLERGAPGLVTTAYRDGEEWVVNGEKLWTTNSSGWDARGATLQCVVCRETTSTHPNRANPTLSEDPSFDPSSNIMILIITREDIAANPPSAYTIPSHPSLTGHISANGPLTKFTNLRVPARNILCEVGKGAQIVEQTFGSSAALVGAMSVGIMRSAFDAALHFCKTDTRGGTSPILSHQAVSDRLITAKSLIEASRLLTYKALHGLENGPGGWETRLEAALHAKIFASDAAPRVVLECMAVVGMKSYAADMPFGRMLEDASCLPLFDGGNVGVRRRQVERILRGEGYQAWAGTFGEV